MTTYVVTLNAQPSKDVEVQADSPDEAVALAQALVPKLEGAARPDSISRIESGPESTGDTDSWHEVEGWEITGACEACGKLFLDGDNFSSPREADSEGVSVCVGECPPKGYGLGDVPEIMRADLAAQEPAFRAEMIERYRVADEDARADILAFFESDGPRKVHEAELKHVEGVPTSADLEAALATAWRGPCLKQLREALSRASLHLCREIAHGDSTSEGLRLALAAVEIACDVVGGLPPHGVQEGDSDFVTPEDLKGFPCPCRACSSPPSRESEGKR